MTSFGRRPLCAAGLPSAHGLNQHAARRCPRCRAWRLRTPDESARRLRASAPSRSPMTAVTRRGLPSRIRPISTFSPMRSRPMRVAQLRGVGDRAAVDRGDHVAGLDAGLVGRRAFDDLPTPARPCAFSRPRLSAISGVNWFASCTPSMPRFTSPYWMSCVITAFTMFEGMAKPMPMLPPLPREDRGVHADQLAVAD